MSGIWNKIVNLASQVTGTLPVVRGGTGVTTSTGTGSTVLSTSPTFVTPILGTPTSGNLSNCTNYPIVVPGTTAGLVSSSGVTGYTGGSAISAGFVGQTLTASLVRSAGSNMTTNTTVNICSKALTAGVWVVFAGGGFATSTATVTQFVVAISSSAGAGSAALPSTDTTMVQDSNGQIQMIAGEALSGTSADYSFALPPIYLNVSGTPTLFLVGRATFSLGNVSPYGQLYAVRIA